MLSGVVGVPKVNIMQNELECPGDREGPDGHVAKNRVAVCLSLLGNS